MASFDQGPYYGLVWSRTLLRPRLIKDSKNIKNPLVLLCFRSKIMKKLWFYCVFAQKVAFLVKILVPKCKKHKKNEKKNISFSRINRKKINFDVFYLCFVFAFLDFKKAFGKGPGACTIAAA